MEKLKALLTAYAVLDPEVGYVQGMHLVAAPLLLEVSSEDAFELFVSLMQEYGMRSMFLPGMPGLQVRLYQFDRLLEDHLPAVHVHLMRAGVTSSMYATQWFLTLFAYKFPISMVVRIYDVVVMMPDRIDNILKFGIALMQKNEKHILSKVKLETLLTHLKEGLFAVYQNEAVKSPGSGIFSASAEVTYRVDEFVCDALEITLDSEHLKKYESEYEEAAALQLAREEEQESMKQANITLQAAVRRLEEDLGVLNKEHIELANGLISSKMSLARLEDENEALQSTVVDLKKIIDTQPEEVEAKLRDEMAQLIEKTTTTSIENQRLEDAMSEMERELIDLKMRYATEHQEREALSRKLDILKKSFDA